MVRPIELGVGAFVAAVTASVLWGTGAGFADSFPNVQGGLYSDAQKTLSDAGYTVVVSGRVGDRVEQDKCVVANAQQGSNLDGTGGDKGKVALVYLNCYADVATNKGPGFSAGSVEGKAALDAKAKAAANKSSS